MESENITNYPMDMMNTSMEEASKRDDEPYPFYVLGFTSGACFTIGILGTMGNLLTIIALPLKPRLRTTATAFVVNLAVAELLFCVFILPMAGADYAHLQYTGDPLLSDKACKFFATLRYTLTQVELQTILAIALTRCLVVYCSKARHVMSKPKFIIGYISFIWLYSFIIRLPILLEIFGKYEYNNKTMECDLSQEKLPRLFGLVVEAIIPVFSIFILYILIFIKVKRSSRLVTASMYKKSNNRNSDTELNKIPLSSIANDLHNGTAMINSRRKSSNRSFKNFKRKISETSIKQMFSRQDSRSSQNIAMFRRDTQVARTIFIIFIVIVTCSMPVMFAHIAEAKAGKVENKSNFLLLHVLYWIQYCANVFVYVLFNQQYRHAYIECLALIVPAWNVCPNKRIFGERDVNLRQKKQCKKEISHITTSNSISISDTEKVNFNTANNARLALVIESQSQEDLAL